MMVIPATTLMLKKSRILSGRTGSPRPLWMVASALVSPWSLITGGTLRLQPSGWIVLRRCKAKAKAKAVSKDLNLLRMANRDPLMDSRDLPRVAKLSPSPMKLAPSSQSEFSNR